MKQIVLIKTGGKVAVEGPELNSLIDEIKSLSTNFSFILVHGGGAEVTAESKIHGLEAQFVNGIRMTTSDEMEIVDSILAGKINKRLVRLFNAKGVTAVGISGNDGLIFTGESIDANGDNRTGKVTDGNPKLLSLLLNNEFIPIISSVSMDSKGYPLNINADEVALAVAKELKADMVIFISDIPGILKDNQVIPKIDRRNLDKEIESGVISGGMIPKVNSSVEALNSGVKKVVISNYIEDGDLLKLINSQKGSLITE
ncbi:MAG: acetylglutamate kinase [Spirochaetales bacterium]|nr:acetylglutamate kinase [Spirochaetales bacterium]